MSNLIGPGHTADFPEGSNREFEKSKGGVGRGVDMPDTTRSITTAGGPLRLETVQFRKIGAIGTRASFCNYVLVERAHDHRMMTNADRCRPPLTATAAPTRARALWGLTFRTEMSAHKPWNLFNDDRCTLPENWTRSNILRRQCRS